MSPDAFCTEVFDLKGGKKKVARKFRIFMCGRQPMCEKQPTWKKVTVYSSKVLEVN
ncbi:predicted protein [Sclerotinia sclerotiorum 1980 UF-70]|uniref:Uncharacterized protein n=1 Tax=Sclerotinia sclerotiorum (strain ATCC 18683 / 1980 / Ss-1) TaxID=665079 RepID=A7E5G4_SCLS1|nr:predicted protein [Sclerotinia sclerotiorum 1980 UF-70]EDN91136.1 predicted protein [Sclerotinia sclerotiorum 1980 UF-70]